jgi:hypothetical protein
MHLLSFVVMPNSKGNNGEDITCERDGKTIPTPDLVKEVADRGKKLTLGSLFDGSGGFPLGAI